MSRLAADCRSRLPKEFKSLFTNIGKLGSKIDKVRNRSHMPFFFFLFPGDTNAMAVRTGGAFHAD